MLRVIARQGGMSHQVIRKITRTQNQGLNRNRKTLLAVGGLKSKFLCYVCLQNPHLRLLNCGFEACTSLELCFLFTPNKKRMTFGSPSLDFMFLAQKLADLARTVTDNYVVHLWCLAVFLVVALLCLSNEDLVQLLLDKVDCAAAEATAHHT